MNEVKHTPGPWHVEEEGEVLVIVGPRENCSRNGKRPSWEMAKIDNYIFWDELETEAEDRANARLIAAAPEMLEAGEAQTAILKKAQDILTQYLMGQPKGLGEKDAMNALLGLLDGPEQRAAQALWDAVCAKAKGLTP